MPLYPYKEFKKLDDRTGRIYNFMGQYNSQWNMVCAHISSVYITGSYCISDGAENTLLTE